MYCVKMKGNIPTGITSINIKHLGGILFILKVLICLGNTASGYLVLKFREVTIYRVCLC